MTGLRVVGSEIREGPDALRVAARLRLISVTMALGESEVNKKSGVEGEGLNGQVQEGNVRS